MINTFFTQWDVSFFKSWRDIRSPTLVGFKLMLKSDSSESSAEAVFVCRAQAEYDIWNNHLSAAVGSSAAIFETTLGVTGLGLTIRSNITGLDIAACTRLICAAMANAIKPGFFICAINGVDVTTCVFTETKKVLARASRPVVMLLANLPVIEGPSALEATIITHSLVECEDKVVMCMYEEGANDDFGIHIGTLCGKTITVFRWGEIAQVEYSLLTKDGSYQVVNDWIAEQQYKDCGEIMAEGIWMKQEGRNMRSRYISMREAHVYIFSSPEARIDENANPDGPYRIVRLQEW
jgi:hypothetical protein